MYVKLPAEERVCLVRGAGVVEDKYHFLLFRPILLTERSSFYVKYIVEFGEFILIPDHGEVRWLINKDNIEKFGTLVEDLYLRVKMYFTNKLHIHFKVIILHQFISIFGVSILIYVRHETFVLCFYVSGTQINLFYVIFTIIKDKCGYSLLTLRM